MKKFAFACLILLATSPLLAQVSSITTDVSVLRNFTKNSRFWALGQTVQGLYRVTEKTSAYAWVSYYTTGRFKNNLSATALDSFTTPQTLNFVSRSSLRYRQISIGIRHYLKGSYNSEAPWSLYGLGGFGLLLVKSTNAFAPAVDTAHYAITPALLPGEKNIVRLTADLGLGAEFLLGSGIYLYTDARTWIQSTRYRSPYLINQAVPRVLVLSGGLRILFD